MEHPGLDGGPTLEEIAKSLPAGGDPLAIVGPEPGRELVADPLCIPPPSVVRYPGRFKLLESVWSGALQLARPRR